MSYGCELKRLNGLGIWDLERNWELVGMESSGANGWIDYPILENYITIPILLQKSFYLVDQLGPMFTQVKITYFSGLANHLDGTGLFNFYQHFATTSSTNLLSGRRTELKLTVVKISFPENLNRL